MIKRLLLLLGIFTAFSLAPAASVAAQDAVDPFGTICKDAPSSTVCKDKDLKQTLDSDGNVVSEENPLFGPNGILTTVFNILSLIVGIAAVIVIIVSGLKYATSGNNPQDANNAREGIIYACVGLIIAGLAQTIVRVFLYKL